MRQQILLHVKNNHGAGLHDIVRDAINQHLNNATASELSSNIDD